MELVEILAGIGFSFVVLAVIAELGRKPRGVKRRNRWTQYHGEANQDGMTNLIWFCSYMGQREHFTYHRGCGHVHPCGWYQLVKYSGRFYEHQSPASYVSLQDGESSGSAIMRNNESAWKLVDSE